ncbi:MAG: GntR family transcriptional regulator [Firmicutes bacterium]|nr:GntR family transcriptional regulator [Bacillota bacterium]
MSCLKPIGDGKSVPLRAYDQILKYITEDNMVGDKLPPETDLARQLCVSRTALREALQRLELEGYISRRRRVGTVVLAKRLNLDAGLEKLNSITQIIESAGMKPGTAFRKWRIEPANSLIARMLGIDIGDDVSVIERVRTADGISFCYDINFIPTIYVTEDEEPEIGESLLDYFSRKLGQINQAQAYLYPFTADATISKKLGVNVGHLLMLLEHTHYAPNGKKMWYSRTFHRSDIISFHIIRSL